MSELKLISSNDSQKYSIQMTVKGREYILTKFGDKLGLILKNMTQRGSRFLAFDTRDNAQQFLDELRAKYPEEVAKMDLMIPEIIPVNAIQ